MRNLALVTVAVTVAIAIAATWLALLNADTPRPPEFSSGTPFTALTTLPIAAVGLVIALRYPRHPVAWCFLFLNLSAVLFFLVLDYAVYGVLTAPGRLPAADVAWWLATWTWAIPGFAVAMSVVLFPDGRPPTPRWRFMPHVVLLACVVAATGDALRLDVLTALAILAWPTAYLGAAAVLIVRFRRSTGIEREQLKWVTYAASVVVAISVLSVFTVNVPVVGPLVGAIAPNIGGLVPLAAAIAILRYRLYDIDVVIERTLVYATVSVALAATYILTVVVLQSLLRQVTGGSDVAIALSTLLVVALFQPIRQRAQNAIDRRFYRARYDTARAIDAFSVRLRDEVDLDSVRDHLIAVIGDTIHPAHASVWLRRTAR